MRLNRKHLAAALATLLCWAPVYPAFSQQPPDSIESQPLFDGQTLAGWQPVLSNGAFKVKDGTIVAGEAAMNHLLYAGPFQNGQFKNFDLKLEFMTTPGSNSGVFFHTKPQPGFLLYGYEAQINATHKDRRKTGSLLDVKHVTTSPVPDNQWAEMQLLVNGNRIVIRIDGKTTVDYTQPPQPVRSARRQDRVLSQGQIALQAHDPDSLVYFRNIRIKPLPDEGPEVAMMLGSWLPEEGGPAAVEASSLASPFGIDFDSGGNMIIVELEGGRVHRLDQSGELTLLAGDGTQGYRGDGGPAINATFNGMHNVAVADNDDIYIADSWNHCIRKIDAQSGVITTIAGTGKPGYGGDGGPATQALFDFIMCITLTPDKDRLFVADLKNRRVRAIDLKSGIVTTVAGNGEQGMPLDGAVAIDSPLVDPRAVAVDSQNRVYILERNGHALRVVTPDGRIATVAGTGKRGFQDGPALAAQLNSPKHLCVGTNDHVFIADDQNAAIRRFDPVQRTLTTVLGGHLETPKVQLLRPHGVCVENGKLIVVDTGHHRILRVERFAE